jgi:hypothetical protein
MEVIRATVLDATHLELSHPIDVLPGKMILVSMGEADGDDSERLEWIALSADSLSAAYGDDEPEYSPSMLREHNAEYKE